MKLYMGNIKGPVCRNKLVLLYLCSLLLAESYAPEPNPGPRPPKFLCAVCGKACKWTTPCICCDTCDCWYHQACMGMNDQVFNALANYSWECVQCGIPNFSTGIFDTTVSNVTTTDSEISFSCPNATSSPHKRVNSTSYQAPDQRNDLPMRILLLNCQSIKSPGKTGQLKNMITASQADIIIGTESWFDESICSAEVFPPNFTPYRRDRSTGSQGGGVFILVSNKYTSDSPVELTDESNIEMVWCRLKVIGSRHLYIGAFYKPPSTSDPEYLECLANTLSRIPSNAHLWLGGDFNLADINWKHECPTAYASNAKQCQQLIDITKDAYLEQVVDSPTRITAYSSNILDLFFTNNKSLINKCEILPGIGDHEAVFIESSLRPMEAKKCPRKVHLYKHADYNSIKVHLDSNYNQFINETSDYSADKTWTTFEMALKSLIEKFIPSKVIKGDKLKKPWIDKNIRSKHRKLKRLYSKQKASGKAEDRRKYEKARSTTQKLERQAYWKHVEDLIEGDDDELDQPPKKQKKFWAYIKALRKDSCGIAPLKDKGKLHNEPIDKANILNQQYQSVFIQENNSNTPTPDGDPYPSMNDIEVTPEGVLALLKKLNPNKATGPDMIPSRILKELADQCAPYLSTIFNKCLQSGEVQSIWKTANVSAIFKKGERFKASNYRPVSLTCICCKLLEHIVVSNVMKHFDSHGILTDSQHGFRRKRSCETQLVTLVDELISSMSKGKQFDLAVLDFSKAFD
ncbi:RTJK-like protein, partial [Mya arenaria]